MGGGFGELLQGLLTGNAFSSNPVPAILAALGVIVLAVVAVLFAFSMIFSPLLAVVTAQVTAQVQDQVRDQVREQVWDQVVSSALWGQHDAAFMAWADFWLRAGVIDRGSGLLAVARTAGWWWAFSDVAVLTERPTALHRDAAGRLHNPDGMALQYPDGWGIHALHGVRVPTETHIKTETGDKS